MQVDQFHFINESWQTPLPEKSPAQLIFAFGGQDIIKSQLLRNSVHNAFPHAQVIGCTTSGEILDTTIHDDTLVLTTLGFDATPVVCNSTSVEDHSSSAEAGQFLATTLDHENLRHVFVLSDGQQVNGASLVEGLRSSLPSEVLVTGGLAGDGDRFLCTTLWHDEKVDEGLIIVCGFYGDAIKIGHGCVGGWDSFGPDKLITKSKGNVLYELDHTNALDLYKYYLGEFAYDLPASALLFPLSLNTSDDDESVVRTILSINENEQSMTFAGDMPEGCHVKLMRGNFAPLIEGARTAADDALSTLGTNKSSLAILISCVGRRLLLEQNTNEELKNVSRVLGDECKLSGFYSYGEISALKDSSSYKLHNQTMTLTTFEEIV